MPALNLYEVLEQEFEVLHGPLPANYQELKASPLGPGETDYQRCEKLIAALNALVHDLSDSDKRAALCISGGGIRSATFALGILQGLARCGLLDKFHYVSTVSGGGYIGSWLTTWLYHEKDDITAVADKLKQPIEYALKPEPAALRHLRQYSNYLSPRLGLLSADTWTLIAIYLRNLILNWFVLIPLLGCGLMVPRIYSAMVLAVNSDVTDRYADRMNWCLIAGLVLAVGSITYIGSNRPSTASGKRNNSQQLYLICCLFPLVVSVVLLTIYWAWSFRGQFPILHLRDFALAFAAANLAALVVWAAISGRLRDVQTLYESVAAAASGALAGWLVWMLASAKFLFDPQGLLNTVRIETFTCFAVPLLLAVFIVTAIVFGGLISFITDDEDREWWSRSDAWVLIFIVGWCAVSALVVFGPIGIGLGTAYITGAGGITTGLISLFKGWSPRTGGSTDASTPAGKNDDWLLKIALPLFVVLFLAFLSLGDTFLLELIRRSRRLGELLAQFAIALPSLASDELVPSYDYYGHIRMFYTAPVWLVVGEALALLGISSLMAWFININRFSLQSMYRNRLTRAYLGASNIDRKPNKFTGFDPNDNHHMNEFWPAANPGRRKKLLHVINIALNLVKGDDLAVQHRKAESFTVSALHSGSGELGYRKSREYGGRQGITIGTAMAISGAAASPNMGYHTSAVLSFLMTLFNARLGWWLGNPGKPGNGKLSTYDKSGPRWALRPLVAESLGFTDHEHPYVYLSDGGHFENLGLYEMVRRRCHFVVVSDAGQDAGCKFEDLGGAIRKIRIDFGISIDFEQGVHIFGRSADQKINRAGKYCAVGTINYNDVDGAAAPPGVLIYIKPAFYGNGGNEPRDVYQYAMSCSTFPHETTADQFFTESQFESYRALGAYIIGHICGTPCKMSALSDFVQKARTYSAPPPVAANPESDD